MTKQTKLDHRKTRLRLGRGQVASDNTAKWEARRAFFRAVYFVSPATYWSLFPKEPNETAYQAWRDEWGDDPGAMIRDWQEHWNLRDQWASDVAFNTLRSRLKWYRKGLTTVVGVNPSTPDMFVMPRARDKGTGAVLGIPLMELYWDRSQETRQSVEERLIAAIKAELDRVEQESALPATKTKSPEHFVWLARYQVLRMSAQKITRTLPDRHPERVQILEQRARRVQLAIQDTKDLIGLTLRDDPYRTAKKSPTE